MQSIGDFAENLILNQVGSIKEGKELPPHAQGAGKAPAGRDISNVNVPDSFMKEVLGESFHPQDTPAAEAMPEIVWDQPEQPQASQSLTEETAQQLVPLLEEVRDLLKEMGTTAGMMGVNMGKSSDDMSRCDKVGRQGREKDSGYLTANPAKSRSQILKQSIRNKLKKR